MAGSLPFWRGCSAFALVEYSNIATEGVQIYDDQKKAWRDILPKERENHLRYTEMILRDGLILLGVSFGSWLIGRVTLYVLAAR